MKKCKCCGKDFKKAGRKEYCSTSCKYVKTLAAPGFKYKLTCCTCGKDFLTNARKDTKSCSNKCRYNAPNKIKTTDNFRKKRREWINTLKLTSGCELCGYDKHPAALHFDHIDPSTKEFDISQDIKKAKHKIVAEIAKCRILCANCHSEHTYFQNLYNTKSRTTNDKNNTQPVLENSEGSS